MVHVGGGLVRRPTGGETVVEAIAGLGDAYEDAITKQDAHLRRLATGVRSAVSAGLLMLHISRWRRSATGEWWGFKWGWRRLQRHRCVQKMPCSMWHGGPESVDRHIAPTTGGPLWAPRAPCAVTSGS